MARIWRRNLRRFPLHLFHHRKRCFIQIFQTWINQYFCLLFSLSLIKMSHSLYPVRQDPEYQQLFIFLRQKSHLIHLHKCLSQYIQFSDVILTSNFGQFSNIIFMSNHVQFSNMSFMSNYIQFSNMSFMSNFAQFSNII